eukprot:5462432-Pyramimonas_sp.AAC.1
MERCLSWDIYFTCVNAGPPGLGTFGMFALSCFRSRLEGIAQSLSWFRYIEYGLRPELITFVPGRIVWA